MDILFKNDDFVFSYRVGGILKHNGKNSCYSVRRMMIMPLLADMLRLWRQVWKLLNGNLKKSFMLR